MKPADEESQGQQLSDGLTKLRVAALDVAANAIAITDAKGNIQWVNPAFTELTGYSLEEVIGQNARVLKSGKHDEQIYKDMWRTIISGSVWRGEVINRRKNGSLYFEEMTITPVRSADGSITNFFAVKEDITARKQAQDALRSSEAKLHGIISSAMDAVVSVDEQQRIIVFNRAAEIAFQCQASEALGSTLDRFIPEALRELHHDHIRRFSLDGTTARSMRAPGLLTAVRANGEEFPIEATISQVQADGEKLYTVILRDISERKRVEELLREQANLLDLAHDAIMVSDLDGTIRFWNHGAQEIYGYSKQQATSKNSHDLLRTVFPQPLAEIIGALMQEGRWQGELVHTTQDGRRIVVGSRWALQRDKNGMASSVMEINHDITTRKRAEQALIRSEKLASVGRLAATIAHEINNPLSSALNALFLVGTDPALPDCVKSHLALAEQELARVAHITKQTIGFYREVGSATAIDPPGILDSILELFEPKLRNKNITVQRRYRTTTGIEAIDGEFRQIVSNLISNGIDALQQGGTLHVRLLGPQTLRNRRRAVRLTIADNGEGIAAENLKEIFEPFFTTKQSIGTGLGLWVTSELVKKHEGRLRLRSRLGKGTVVSIWLPIERRGPDRRSA